MKKVRNSILALTIVAVGGSIFTWCLYNQTIFNEIAMNERANSLRYFLLHLVNVPAFTLAVLIVLSGMNGVIYWTTGRNPYKGLLKLCKKIF